MAGWFETYPHKVYASMLVLGDRRIDCEIGENYWKSPLHVSLRGQVTLEEFEKCEVLNACWVVNDAEEHDYAFNVLSRKWMEDALEEIRINNAV